MKVLVIGKSGREHALAWKLAHRRSVDQVFCAPGNAGTADDGVNVPIEVNDFPGLIQFAKKEEIALTVVGPEDPLAEGIVGRVSGGGPEDLRPTKAAAQIEASKVFAKKLMWDANVPTAEFRVFDHPDPARTYVQTREYPVVVKADGLAAGKGVIVCNTGEEALAAIERDHGARGVRSRRRPADHHRKAARRRRTQHPGAGFRTNYHSPGSGAGSQAGPRQRPGPQHRRHGRVFARSPSRPSYCRKSKPTPWCRWFIR